MPIQDKEISDKILNAFFAVYNGLGYGFLEKVYENAMVHAMRQRGLQVEQQRRISVYFDGVMVGDYFADIHTGREQDNRGTQSRRVNFRIAYCSVDELPEGNAM